MSAEQIKSSAVSAVKSSPPRDRFACKCGCGGNMIDPRVMELHRRIEKDLQRAIEVTSGYRCPVQNEEVGGSPTSAHLSGLAWDVACPGSRDRWLLVGAAIRIGINRIGIGKGFVHLDIDRSKPPRVIWLY